MCKARYLTENVQQWEDTQCEAALTHMPNVTERLRLRDTYNGDLTENFVHSGDIPFNAKQRALSHIQQLLPKQLSEYNLSDLFTHHQLLQTHNSINNIEAFENTEQMRNTLTTDQQKLCDDVLQSLTESRNSQLIEHRLFFVDVPGGSGKICCYNYLIHELEYCGLSISSSASTGIASTLLRDGSTIHSTFIR